MGDPDQDVGALGLLDEIPWNQGAKERLVLVGGGKIYQADVLAAGQAEKSWRVGDIASML